MLIPDDIKVHLYCGVTDMRKSINTLAIMVQDVLQMELTSGHLFLFRSRGGDKLKALYYEEHSFTLWYRRLDKGKFIFPRNIHGHLELTREHFNWLLASNKFVHYQGEDPLIYRNFY
jgi:transposase